MDINPYEAPRSSGFDAPSGLHRLIPAIILHLIPVAILMLAIAACGVNYWLPYYYSLMITEYATFGQPIVAIVGVLCCRRVFQWMFAAILILALLCVAIGLSFDQMENRLLPRDSIIWMLPIQLSLTAAIVWMSLLVSTSKSRQELGGARPQ